MSMVSWFPWFGGVNDFMVLNPPRIPEFYTLTKIHESSPVGRPYQGVMAQWRNYHNNKSRILKILPTSLIS